VDKDKLGSTLDDIAETKEETIQENQDPIQKREVLPFSEWVSSDYYAGPISSSIFTFWENSLSEFFEGDYSTLIIDGGKGAGKCIEENEKVLLSNGKYKKIKNVDPGDKVVSLDEGSESFVGSKVESLVDSGKRNGYKIKTRTGKELIVSEDHEFLTPFGWKNMKNGLQEGDQITIPETYKQFGEKNVDKWYAKFMGYYLSEGCSSGSQITLANTHDCIVDEFESIADHFGLETTVHEEEKRNSKFLSLNVDISKYYIEVSDEEKPYFEKGEYYICSVCGEREKERLKIGHHVTSCEGNTSKIYRECENCGEEFSKYYSRLHKRNDGAKGTVFCSEECKYSINPLMRIIREYGLEQKDANDKFIPDDIFTWDEQSLKYFIESLFDGDGTRDKNKSVFAYSTNSETMVKQIQSLLLRFGIVARIRSLKRDGYDNTEWTLKVTGKDALKFSETFDCTRIDTELDMDDAQNRLHFSINYSDEQVDRLLEKTSEIYGFWKDVSEEVYRNGKISSSTMRDYGIRQSEAKVVSEKIDSDVVNKTLDGDVLYDEIREITDIGEVQMYDLEIEGTHNFVANDIVAHNTFCGSVMMVYKVYTLSCYEYPQRLLGLADSSDITFAYFNVKSSLARSTGYSEIRGFIETIPYFQENFPLNPEYKREIQLPNEIYIKYSSTESGVKGDNVLGSLTDEVNFFQKGGSGSMGDVERIRGIANDLEERRKTRFQTQGHDPGFMGIISSSTHAKSYIEERKRKAGDEALHVKGVSYLVRPWEHAGEKATEEDYPTWDDLPDDRKFWIFQGREDMDPEVVDSFDKLDRILSLMDENLDYVGENIHEAIRSLPSRVQDSFITAPIDLKHQFESELISSLQGIAGIAVGTKGDFFNNEQVWNRCESESIPFAFNREEPVLSTGDSVTLQDYFNKDAMLIETDNGYYEPKMNPERKRFIHIDLSSTKDPTGMAMCHISGFKDDDGKEPIITYDFMVRIKPPSPPDRLSHEKIRKFVLWLKQEAGYRVENITMDSYSSEGPIQWFNEHVVPVKSNKKKDKKAFKKKGRDTDLSKWSEFSKLLYEDRVNFSPYEVFRQEFYELEVDYSDKGGTVDHPSEFTDGSTGHNDVSCAVVNAGHTAIQSEDYYIGAKDEIDELVDVDTDENPEDVLDQYQGQANKSVEDIYMDRLEEEIIDLL
jgi:intein/homing endonuclease